MRVNFFQLPDPDSISSAAFVLSADYCSQDDVLHFHQCAQLLHAADNVITVKADAGVWVVPPHRAVWIPPGFHHMTSSKKSFRLLTLYVKPGIARMPSRCCVVSIDPLVNELLKAAAEFEPEYPKGGPEERLLMVILDRLPLLEVMPLYLPQPQDSRLRRLTALLEEDLASGVSMERAAILSGLSSRTAARLFRKETGMTFTQWRQQLRVLMAMERLGAGASVTEAALDVGYQDVSSFINVFRQVTGTTPASFFM